MLALTRIARPFLVNRLRYGIIANLFKKRNQRHNQAPAPPPPEPETTEGQEKEDDDGEYNFFERRREIDTSFDFGQLKGTASDNIPEDVGRGGLEQVIYWSQSAVTPDQILQVVLAFNKTYENTPKKQAIVSSHMVHMQQFNSRVLGTIYLLSNMRSLRQVAVYAYKMNLEIDEFWEKVEYRTIKIFPEGEQELGWLIDIGFIMGQYQFGSTIYNHVAKMLQHQDLTIDQAVKLYLTFNMLKIGEKVWIDKLLQNLVDQMLRADGQQMTAVIPALKDAKKLPQNMAENIEKRSMQIIDQLSIGQVIILIDFFGVNHQNKATWQELERRFVLLLKKQNIDLQMMTTLIHKVMNTYQLSTDFIRSYIVEPLVSSNLAMLDQFSVTTLAALSKGLYIYELETETKGVEVELSKLVISRMTREISELSDVEIVKVIQDYNLTRNGSRQLYIFLEEVVKIRYLKGYHQETDRNTVELLIDIYGNSGMCSRDMYDGLQNLILDSQ